MLDTIQLDDPEIAVRLNVSRRARRFTLRLAPGGDSAVLTMPPGVPHAEACGFVRRHAGWLRQAIDRQGPLIPVAPGVWLPVDGVPRLVEARTGRRMAPQLEPDRLLLPGRGAPGPRLAAWLRARARMRMAPEVERFSARLGVRVAGLRIKDTRSRWGSCSSAGGINLSWRLAMAPPEVQAYVAAHEVAHLVEMNHQPAYWRVLARLLPDYEHPRAWLRAHGRGLHAWRFD